MGAWRLGLAVITMAACGQAARVADAPGLPPDAPVPDAPCLGAGTGPDAPAGTFACGFGTCKAGELCYIGNEGPPCPDGPDAGQCGPSWCFLVDGHCVADRHFCAHFRPGCSTCASLLAEWLPPAECASVGGTRTCAVSAAGDVTLSCPFR